MGIALLISTILSVIGVAVSAGVSAKNAQLNQQSVEQTNATNLQLTREANQSNVEQANLAYQRSLPINQVNNLIAAGMSKQGALNSLTGGGSYTAPTLQAGHADAPQMDLSGIASAFQRLDNIPSNVEQLQLVDAQRRALEVDTQNKMYENQRQQEQHDFNMWKQSYDKDVAISLDNASSKIASSLLDSGKTIEDFKDFETLLRELGLDKDDDIRNLPASAREQLEQSARNKFQIEYDRQSQENENEEQENKNRRTNEDVQTSRQARRLAREEQNNRNQEQRNRNTAARDAHRLNLDEHQIKQATLRQLGEDYMESVNEHNIAHQRRLLEQGEIRLKRILQQRHISEAEFLNSIHTNPDGSITFDEKARIAIKDCWNYLMDVTPVGYASDILKNMLKK